MFFKDVIKVIIIFLCLIFSGISYPFEINPTEKQIEDAIAHGKLHSWDVFESDRIKAAQFGEWPASDGGIVESKLVYLTIVSSMRVRANMPDISKEQIDTIMQSKEMPIRIASSQNVFNIVLKQGDKTIEPLRIEKAAMGMPPGGPGGEQGGRVQALKVFFNYAELDPKGEAKVIFYEDFGEKEFSIDFSKFD